MIIVRYTLTAKGKTPEYIIDGGYFPKKNNKQSPQDWDLIGISSGNIGLEKFNTKADLRKYVNLITSKWHQLVEVPFDQASATTNIWSKLTNG